MREGSHHADCRTLRSPRTDRYEKPVEDRDLNPSNVIRLAAAAGIDLPIEAGKLVATSPHGLPPMDLLAAIRADNVGILGVLAAWPQCATLRAVTLDRSRPTTPADLTPTERIEAETLAAELADSGGLGWFVICLTGRWNDLSDRDRLQAPWCWEYAIVGIAVSIAA